MNRPPEPRFPSRLTYVLKLRIDSTADALVGRLENLVTARRVEFSSGRELLDLIAHDIGAGPSDSPGE